jgi:hydroxypyruvate isomerase
MSAAMYDLAVCAETVFTSLPFVERVIEIARAGFKIEFWRRSGADIDALEQAMQADSSIQICNFSGSFEGSMMDPRGVQAFIAAVKVRLPVAKRLRCRQMMILSGELGPHGEAAHPIATHPATRWITAYRVLCQLAELAEAHDVSYCLENLNTKIDHSGYPLSRVEDTVRLVEQVGSPRVRILLDIYHAQVEEGNIVQAIRDFRRFIGHIHVADVPGRHEPGTGEINYTHVASVLRETGYQGTVGLEASPLYNDTEALHRFREVFGQRCPEG